MQLRRITAEAVNSKILIRLSIAVWGVPEFSTPSDAPPSAHLDVGTTLPLSGGCHATAPNGREQETKASSILQFMHGLRGELHVTWEEGTWVAWLDDLLLPLVEQVVVWDVSPLVEL